MFGLDALAAVLHAEVRAGVVGPPAHADAAFVRGVFDRVEDQVGEGAAQFRFAALELQAVVGLQADAVVAVARQRLGVGGDRQQQQVNGHGLVVRGVIGGFQLGQQQQVIEQGLHAPILLLHLLQGTAPARVHLFDIVEQGFQVAGNHRQRRAQFVGDVGDKVFAHLLQLMHAGYVAHQHQVFVVAVAGDLEVHAQVVVERRGQFQRFAEIALLEVFLEARMAHQVGDRLAAVLRGFQAQQGFRGEVPPFQVAVAVEHDHRVLEGGGGFLHAVDHRLQAATGALVAALQAIDAVEHFAPQAMAVGWWLIDLVLFQPDVQTQQLAQVPAQIQAQAEHQSPGVVAAQQTEEQTAADNQEQAAEQNAVPVLIHGISKAKVLQQSA